MKKIITILAFVSLLAVSCKDDIFGYQSRNDGKGTLTVGNLALDEELIPVSKAVSAAPGSYRLFVYNTAGDLVWEKSYEEVKNAPHGESLLAGSYTLVVRSSSDEAPAAAFETPVYGTSTAFSITAGQTTNLGTLTCTLVQCAVTVGYNEDFLATVTGDGYASVEVTTGSPLDYQLRYNGGSPAADGRMGYFAVNGGDNTTMTVTFRGSLDGKNQKMRTQLGGIKARDWHKITFLKKVDGSGNAIFGIEIDGLIADAELVNDVTGEEIGDGNDPNAPSGDGGIQLISTCDYDINVPVVVPATGTFPLTMKAIVPNGTRKFTVDIASTNADFIASVNSVGGCTLDLINPSEAALGVFGIVPFPHGAELAGKTEIDFNLAEAQVPLLAFKGTHSFTMNVTDAKGCRKSIAISLVVE